MGPQEPPTQWENVSSKGSMLCDFIYRTSLRQ